MIKVSIDGMSCQNCVRHVKQALENLDSVTAAEVAIGSAELQVTDDLTDAQLAAALDEEGFDLISVERG